MRIPINKVKLNPTNPRVIKDDKYKKLVQSLKDFPEMAEVREIVVNKDHVILGGNMRFRAMQEAGWTEIPVKVVDWSEEKQREFVIKDNASFGEWDWDELSNQYEAPELEEWGLDLPKDFNPSEVEEDEAPEVSSDPPHSVLGEVYQLGRHRVMCADSTECSNVERLLNGQLADLIVTDPPYNTGMTAKSQGEEGKKKSNDSTWLSHMFNDKLTPEQYEDLLREVFANMLVSTKGEAAFYVFIDWRSYGLVKSVLEENVDVKNVIVWDKMVHGLGSDYKFTHEFIVVGKKGKPEINNRFGEDYQDIWHVQRKIGRNDDHATAKPVELVVKPINHASKQDDIVLDLFLGSGTTLIACEQTSRTCCGMELDPRYVDVIRKRYWKFTHDNNEEGWEEGTPAISGDIQVESNAIS